MHNQLLLAIDFGGTKVAIATADLKQGILKRTEITSRNINGYKLIQRALDTAQRLLEDTKKENDLDLAAIGIGTFGVVFEDHVELAPNVEDWDKINIGEHVKDRFGNIPFSIENDVKAAALAELRKGALKGTDHGLYINFGTGISAGFTFGNQVIRGHNGAAGEIAYLLKSKQEMKGFQSNYAPFEAYASGSGLSERAKNDFGNEMTVEKLFSEAKDNPEKRTFLKDTFNEIGFQIANLAIAWNPEKIVLGGGLMHQFNTILPTIESYFQQFVPYQPKIEKAHFDRDASLFGAVELAHDLLRGKTSF
ncbi:ROK family protein [Heyndrickxia acidicola]|uniref:ROK family protein n=1 Tax=Heyndrickxia acidicola TaxID=209389 RepID=A0ABU6MG02_9BACI|nr:ROK family protein [Heyndrickxia acidicola]MED1203620.1 ROK family protein [Heyndrickxia acidicola]